jgi:hypothetical protein
MKLKCNWRQLTLEYLDNARWKNSECELGQFN